MGPLTLLAWTLAGAGASVGLWASLAPRPRPVQSRRAAAPRPVLLLRPCAGLEPALARTLASAPRSSAPLSIRLAVADRRDPATPVAEGAARSLSARGIDARVVITGAIGPNRKADQLARAMASAPDAAPIVAVADSDVDLEGVDLDDLVAPLDAGASAAWAAPVEVEPETIADRASASILDASLHAFALLASLDPSGMVGKLFAVERAALEAAGGFGALVSHLGEDMELARRLAAGGGSVALARVAAPSLARGRSFADVVARYARWITVIRAQRPHLLPSYPLLFAQLPAVLAVALAGALHEGPLAAAALALALAGRAFVALAARARSGRPVGPGALGGALLAELALTCAFARALSTRTVRWRGALLAPTRAGLEPVREAAR